VTTGAATVGVVVLPSADAEALSLTVGSALEQTTTDLEVIVIDAGGDTADRARVSDRERVRVIGAERAGVTRPDTEFVALARPGDRFLSRKLEQQLEAMRERTEAVLCYTGHSRRLPDGRPGGDLGAPDPGQVTADELLLRCPRRWCCAPASRPGAA
jgi:hypothetical protein